MPMHMQVTSLCVNRYVESPEQNMGHLSKRRVNAKSNHNNHNNGPDRPQEIPKLNSIIIKKTMRLTAPKRNKHQDHNIYHQNIASPSWVNTNR
ncbi:hypothetical protein LguiB_001615 [Lonicera macranthoides]